jgi:hypothetical protein
MNPSLMKHLTLVLVVSYFLFPSSPVAADSCYDCHGQKGMKGYVDRSAFEQSAHGHLACTKCHYDISGYPHAHVSKVNCGACHFIGAEGAPKVQAQQFKMSVHSQARAMGNTSAPTCQTCHGSHYIYPSADSRSATYRPKVPVLCSKCHQAEFEVYKSSIHGKQLLVDNNPAAPTCFQCHMEHMTPPTANNQWQLSLIKQCGNCHAEEMKTYRKTYHGKVTELGYSTMAKCADCHGSHDILMIDNPDSSLSQKNILHTCQKCHPAATPGFTKFYAHPEEKDRAKYPVLYYTFVGMTVLLLGTFTFFLTHTFLWAYRSLKERMSKKGGE